MSKSSVETYFKPQTGCLFLVHMRLSTKFPIGNKNKSETLSVHANQCLNKALECISQCNILTNIVSVYDIVILPFKCGSNPHRSYL